MNPQVMESDKYNWVQVIDFDTSNANCVPTGLSETINSQLVQDRACLPGLRTLSTNTLATLPDGEVTHFVSNGCRVLCCYVAEHTQGNPTLIANDAHVYNAHAGSVREDLPDGRLLCGRRALQRLLFARRQLRGQADPLRTPVSLRLTDTQSSTHTNTPPHTDLHPHTHIHADTRSGSLDV